MVLVFVIFRINIFLFLFFKWQNGGYGFPCVGSYCILCAWKVYWWKRKHVRKLKNIYTHHLLSFPIILQKPWSLRDYFEDADFKKCHELQKKIFNASKLIACHHHNSSASLCPRRLCSSIHDMFSITETCIPKPQKPLYQQMYKTQSPHWSSWYEVSDSSEFKAEKHLENFHCCSSLPHTPLTFCLPLPDSCAHLDAWPDRGMTPSSPTHSSVTPFIPPQAQFPQHISV